MDGTDRTADAAQRVCAAAWVSLAALLLLNTMNFVDRTLPFILIGHIQRDLDLSDTEIGLLGGVVFSLVYAIAGIPLGRLADRVDRRRFLGAAAVLWGVMTAAGGLAGNFLQLAASRFGLAAAEATAAPFGTSMIADLFPLSRRRTALAIYLSGSSVGGLFGLWLGGALSESLSWRTVFFIFAAPPVLLGLVMMLLLPEPPRRGAAEAPGEPHIRLTVAIGSLLRIASFRHLALGAGLFVGSAIALFHFSPIYLMRRFDLSAADVGLSFGVATGVSGLAGTLFGGWLTDRLARRDPRWGAWVSAAAVGLALPVFLLAWRVSDPRTCVALLTVGMFVNTIYLGPTFANVQLLAGPARRGLAVALLAFAMYGLGASIGPAATGLLSDALRRTAGDASLQGALSLTSLVFAWSATHFLLATRTLSDDLERGARAASAEVTA